MRKIIIIIMLSVVSSIYSQKTLDINSNLWVSYQMDYKKFIVLGSAAQSVNTTLIVNSRGSLFTFESMINLSKIQQKRLLSAEDALANKSPYYYLIKNEGSVISHYEAIGNDSYKFEENLSHQWKLVNQDTLIKGYSCKKALLDYAGRQWSAWYAPKIPIAVGPYKFYGLPGLIMRIKDNENIFDFTVNDINSGNFVIDPIIDNYFIKEEGRTFEKTVAEKFYETRIKFYEMSLNEKLQHMNRENEAKPNFIIQGANGENPRVNRQSKKRNFIERFK